MATTTVRISDRTHQRLRHLAAQSGEPLSALVDAAVEALQRERFFDTLDAAYLAMADDDRADLEAEYGTWEVTLADGLPDGRR